MGTNDHIQQVSENINKACRLIDYHLKLAALKSRPVKDIDSYDSVVWLNDIPRLAGCYSRSWGPDESFDDEIWIEVISRKEPELPPVPEKCRSWVTEKSLHQKNDIPILLNEITILNDTEYSVDIEQYQDTDVTLKLSDNPDIQQVWEKYIENDWLPWVEMHNEWEAIMRVYEHLFEIYQAQIKMSEEYELILGIGLLAWKPHFSSTQIKRHVVITNVQLEFNPSQGRFTVIPNQDDDIVKAEFDMIDPEDAPVNLTYNSKTAMKELQGNYWDANVVADLLQTIVRTLDPHGAYASQMIYDGLTETKPVITYSPAIILRKRSTSGLRNVFDLMKQRIIETGIIPVELQDLCEIVDRSQNMDNDEQLTCEPKEEDTDYEVYFPKPANDEQRAIIGKINNNGGVLVQGPPGTGKSHTIANLISHLLATGKRTLITAKTPRALKVLEKLIPEELRPLCISLLGTGIEENQSMESSVNDILIQHETWNSDRSNQAIKQLKNRLEKLREEMAAIGHQIRQIRESETQQIVILDGAYKGSAAKIAQTLNEQEQNYNWFIDEVDVDSPCPVEGNKAVALFSAKRVITDNDYLEINLRFPDHIPSPEEVSELFDKETKFDFHLQRLRHIAEQDGNGFYNTIDANTLHQLKTHLHNVYQLVDQLLGNPSTWVNDALHHAVYGTISSYEARKNETEHILYNISAYCDVINNISVHIPTAVDSNELYNNIKIIVDYAEIQNGSINSLFLPHRVRKARSFMKKAEIKINSQAPNSLEQLKNILWYIYVELEISRATSFWSDLFEINGAMPALQITNLQAACKQVDLLTSLFIEISQTKQLYTQLAHIKNPDWLSLNSIELEQDKIDFALSSQALKNIQKLIDQHCQDISKQIQSENCHSISHQLMSSIIDRDVTRYHLLYHEWKNLYSKKQQIHSLDDEYNHAFQQLPELKERIEVDLYNEIWSCRLSQIQKAWVWKQAIRYLEKFLDCDLIPDLSVRVKQIEHEINQCIEKIAAFKAWAFCFSRLKDNHRRHMVGWQQSMRKLGKATGKYAPVHRKDAQYHLSECRDAIPAWIMPLHRIWDTVYPAPGLFDVVIVDEASQCGFESLPLFYLAKKIIVVGDDRQISPEGGFISGEAVIQYKRELLYDFAYATSFGIESSLFDQAKLRYGTNRVTLREHFRCMPEIIHFSNTVSYPDTPLIPLRQYGKNRLEPLKSIFVSEGYREGNQSRVINRPEAKTIAELIEDMCKDDQYQNKTIGVVVLQGEEQGKLIETELLKKIGAEEIKKRRIVCGNPYSFQGDERDIIIISMVIDSESRTRSLTTEADKRRFNVTASRARDQMILVHSVTTDDLGPTCLRRKLLEFFQEARRDTKNDDIQRTRENLNQLIITAKDSNRSIVKPPNPFDSWFEVDVYIKIASRGYFTMPQFEVAGKRIDIVVIGGNRRIAVECDGDYWHGPEQYDHDMHRQQILERCNWIFYRIRESMFYLNQEESLKSLWSLLNSMDICPINEQPNHHNSENKEPINKPVANKPEEETKRESHDDTPTAVPVKPDKQSEKMSLLKMSLIETLNDESLFDTKSGISRKYGCWQEQNLFDPREINIVEVGDILLDIVQAEGPMLCYRAYLLYANAAGIGRISNEIRVRFDMAIKSKISAGKILSENELNQMHIYDTFIRAENTPAILLRARGDRKLDDIPPSEIALLAAFICRESKMYVYSRPDLLRRILDYYGLIKLTSKAENYINLAIDKYDVMELCSEDLNKD